MKFSKAFLRLTITSCLTVAMAFSAKTIGMKAGKPALKSAGPLAFGPDAILFVGDSVGAAIVALDSEDWTPARSVVHVYVKGVNQQTAAMIGVAADQHMINEL